MTKFIVDLLEINYVGILRLESFQTFNAGRFDGNSRWILIDYYASSSHSCVIWCHLTILCTITKCENILPLRSEIKLSIYNYHV